MPEKAHNGERAQCNGNLACDMRKLGRHCAKLSAASVLPTNTQCAAAFTPDSGVRNVDTSAATSASPHVSRPHRCGSNRALQATSGAALQQLPLQQPPSHTHPKEACREPPQKQHTPDITTRLPTRAAETAAVRTATQALQCATTAIAPAEATPCLPEPGTPAATTATVALQPKACSAPPPQLLPPPPRPVSLRIRPAAMSTPASQITARSLPYCHQMPAIPRQHMPSPVPETLEQHAQHCCPPITAACEATSARRSCEHSISSKTDVSLRCVCAWRSVCVRGYVL